MICQIRYLERSIAVFLLFGISLFISAPNSSAAELTPNNIPNKSHTQPSDTLKSRLKYISTNFENASQLDWEIDSSLLLLDKNGPEFKEKIITPLENLSFVLEAIIRRIPPPKGDVDAPLQALIFDSVFNSFRGIIAYYKILNGTIKKGDKVKFTIKNPFESIN